MLCINANKPGIIANKVQNSIPPIENQSKFSTTTAAQGKTKNKTKKRLSSDDGSVKLPRSFGFSSHPSPKTQFLELNFPKSTQLSKLSTSNDQHLILVQFSKNSGQVYRF